MIPNVINPPSTFCINKYQKKRKKEEVCKAKARSGRTYMVEKALMLVVGLQSTVHLVRGSGMNQS
jgi:hypothetical protein